MSIFVISFALSQVNNWLTWLEEAESEDEDDEED